jgi:Region found in RelA / SpoT proteins
MCVPSQALVVAEDQTMQWVVPEHPTRDVDNAGNILASENPDPHELDEALGIINNWRASHHFPINTFQITLRRKAEQFADSSVAQRVKRLRAIQFKLRKHTKNPIPLSSMQDIGGCRVVLPSMKQVRALHQAYLQSGLKHELVHQDDYIAHQSSQDIAASTSCTATTAIRRRPTMA